MSEPARNRFALDLEDLERQLRGAAQPPRPGQASDPLVELTRIVGQDDPLKDLFAQRPAAGGPHLVHPVQTVRQEPSFAPPAEPVGSAPPAELRGALDEFEALLRRTDVPQPEPVEAAPVAEAAPMDDPGLQPYRPVAPSQGDQAGPRDLDEASGAYPYAYEQSRSVADPAMADQGMADDDMPDLEPRRSRKGLWTAAALMAVGVIGVGAAMTFRSTAPSGDGTPLLITADKAPIKVEPANPGGAEIPNQNKQIYERATSAQPTRTKIVTSEEQPIDVQQAARALPRVVTPASAATNPLAQAPLAPERVAASAEPLLTPVPPVPGLGEPRKVRTVSIRPDGAPVNVAPLVTGSAPSRPSVEAPITAETPPPRPRQAATPAPAEPPKAQERVAAAATTPAPPVRVANVQPAQPVAARPTPAAAAIRSGTGDFTVQLAAPGSESEARATFSALQRKYPDQLRGQSPIVRKTDLAGGKTVFRLRVGPYSREDASTMCTQLQSAGGQCFIARN